MVENKAIVVEPPRALSSEELDTIALLPFERKAHPRYKQAIPAFSFVKDSVVAHRGCYGGCSFCALTVHQGKYIASRSQQSILDEISKTICAQPNFCGVLLDVGGPSANMYSSFCKNPQGCSRLSCLVPSICAQLDTGLERQLQLLEKISMVPGIRKIFLNSGIRTDLAQTCPKYIETIASRHTSGQLSVAPEHKSTKVLRLMQKPRFENYKSFITAFKGASLQANKQQFLSPYFIAAHPGTTLADMVDLAFWMRRQGMRTKQIQLFLPLPMTLSSAMYYAEADPWTLQPIYVAKGEDRKMQRALLQPWLEINKPFVRRALKQLGLEKQERWLCGGSKK